MGECGPEPHSPILLNYRKGLYLCCLRDCFFTGPRCLCLIEQIRYYSRPASLVAGTDSRPVISMKVLMEGDVVLPMRVALERVDRAEYRPPTVSVAEKDALQASGDVACDLPQRELLT